MLLRWTLRMHYYVGILDGWDDVWGVRIPDLPGCHGGGGSAEAAIEDAISGMREWAELIVSDGQRIPPPRSVAEVMADPAAEFDTARGESIVMLPLLLDRGRPVRANISLDSGLLAAIDAEAKRRGLTRSAFLVSAALDKIETGK